MAMHGTASTAAAREPVTGAGPVRRLAVIGVGLIGGSFALALRERGLVERVVGVGRGAANLRAALDLGIVDEVAADAAAGAAGADLVLVATPVAQMPAVFAAIAPRLAAEAIVTDAGSTKRDVVAAARAVMGEAFARFVPAHPIAGTEHTGAAAAFGTLFERRRVVLTPQPETRPEAVRRVADLWAACGARVARLAPEEHDRVFAAVSHLPHLLAFALVEAFASRADGERLFEYAASGFRDFTRIAASSPEMWRDICLANRDALRAELDAYRERLGALDALLAAGDAAGLQAAFARARAARERWGSRAEGAPPGGAVDGG